MRAGRGARWILVVAVLVLSGCTSGGPVGTYQFSSPGGQGDFSYPRGERQPVGEIAGPAVGDPAVRLSTADHRGKVVVLNFWGSWCGPCRKEAPNFRDAAAAFADEPVQFLGVNVRDDAGAAEAFETSKDMNFPSIFDPSTRTMLSIRGLPPKAVPTTLVLDPQGAVAQVWVRPVTRNELEATLRALLAESP